MRSESHVFDYQEMMSTYLNDEAMVLETLVYFKHEGQNKLEFITRAFENNNFDILAFHCHALKGDAGNLCANGLASQAEKIEIMAKTKSDSLSKKDFIKLEQEFEAFLEAIAPYLAEA